MIQIRELDLQGLKLITNDVFPDERGSFQELYHKEKYAALGIHTSFVQQDNLSRSKKNVVRGLHFQWDKPLTKLMRVMSGRLLAVAVDMRIDSPTFGKHSAIELSEDNAESLFVPFGFATGICALSDNIGFTYKYSAAYNPKDESNFLWNDPALEIDWRVKDPIVSPRDQVAQTFAAWQKAPESKLFTMEASEKFGAGKPAGA